MYSSERHSNFMDNWSSFGLVWRYEEHGLHILVWIWILYRFILKCLNFSESHNFMFVNLMNHIMNAIEYRKMPCQYFRRCETYHEPLYRILYSAMPFNLCEFNDFPMWSRILLCWIAKSLCHEFRLDWNLFAKSIMCSYFKVWLHTVWSIGRCWLDRKQNQFVGKFPVSVCSEHMMTNRHKHHKRHKHAIKLVLKSFQSSRANWILP